MFILIYPNCESWASKDGDVFNNGLLSIEEPEEAEAVRACWNTRMVLVWVTPRLVLDGVLNESDGSTPAGNQNVWIWIDPCPSYYY